MADAEQYGPTLPPATQTEARVTLGPTLPPGYIKLESNNQEGSDTGDSVHAGSNMEIGPMVSEMSHGDEVVQAAEDFERRSRKMKDHLTIKAEAEPGPSKREEWMTELPTEMSKNIGVTARTFSKGVGQDDKDPSEWTDTPADKLKKEKKGKKRKREEERNPAKQRDQHLQQQVDEYNKKNRAESLVEMHQKSKKKKKKEEKKKKKKKKKDKKKEKETEKKPERRAFDRDKDLKANHFDDAQRKAIIKKSALLHTRFQHSGSTTSFL